MTNEKIIAALYVALDQVDKEKSVDNIMNLCNYQNGDLSTVYGIDYRIAELIYKLETEEKAKTAKAAGKAELLQVAKSILKDAKKNLEYKPQFHNAFTCNNKQVFCDGFRALIISDSKKLDLFTNEKQVMDIDAITPTIFEKSAILPALQDLKTEFKRFKNMYNGEKIVVRFFDENNNVLIGFNGSFLIDAIKATGAEKVLLNAPNKTAILENKDVKALLMPIQLKHTKKEGIYHYIDVDATGIICITTETITDTINETA